jgi:MFS family permease
MANFETASVSTTLVTITQDLGGFDKVDWVITSYLLGFVGMDSRSCAGWARSDIHDSGLIMTSAKLSDIFGRKVALAGSLLIFIIFSGACGAAQTLTQLYATDYERGWRFVTNLLL